MKNYLYLLCLGTALTAASCKSTQQDDTACVDPSKIDPNGACTMQYDPVCGCDQKTYSNACMADKAGVTSYTKGECPDAK